MSFNGTPRTPLKTTTYDYGRSVKIREDYGPKDKSIRWQPPLRNLGLSVADLPLYGADDLRRLRPGEFIFFPEGEKNVDYISACGLVAVTNCGSSSQKEFGDALAILGQYPQNPIVLLQDFDSTGSDLDHVLAAKLGAIHPDVRWTVPNAQEAGADLADLLDRLPEEDRRPFIQALGKTAVPIPEAPDDATSVETEAPDTAVSAADMDEPLPRRWLIEGMLPERWPTILYGDGGVGKTTISNHLAVCLSTGLPWFGRNTTPANVLIVDAELDQEEFSRRMWPIARGLGLKAPPRGVYYWRLPGPLGDNDVVDRLFAIAAQRAVSLIVIDSLTLATYSSDQYVANDLAAVIFRFTRQGIATLFLDHHARQGRMDEGTRVDPYGSVMKRNLARSSIYLQTSGPGMVRLSSNKASFASQWDPFTTEVRFEGDFPDQTITYHTLAANDPRIAQAESRSKDDEIMEAIQELMEGDPETYGLGVNIPTLNNVVTGINADALRMRCMRLEKSHRLIRPTTGKFAIPYLVRTPPEGG